MTTDRKKKEIKERINLLAAEINANEEENNMMSDEIDELYEELDSLQ